MLMKRYIIKLFSLLLTAGIITGCGKPAASSKTYEAVTEPVTEATTKPEKPLNDDYPEFAALIDDYNDSAAKVSLLDAQLFRAGYSSVEPEYYEDTMYHNYELLYPQAVVDAMRSEDSLGEYYKKKIASEKNKEFNESSETYPVGEKCSTCRINFVSEADEDSIYEKLIENRVRSYEKNGYDVDYDSFKITGAWKVGYSYSADIEYSDGTVKTDSFDIFSIIYSLNGSEYKIEPFASMY